MQSEQDAPPERASPRGVVESIDRKQFSIAFAITAALTAEHHKDDIRLSVGGSHILVKGGGAWLRELLAK